MPTTHIFPFNLTRDDSWRETTETKTSELISQPCIEHVYIWDNVSLNSTYDHDNVVDSSSVDASLANVQYRLSSRFNSDPTFKSSIGFGCPRPVSFAPQSKAYRTNDTRKYNFRTHRWDFAKPEAENTPLTSRSRPKLERKPNALYSKFTERYFSGGTIAVQQRQLRPGHTEDEIDDGNKYIYVTDCVYDGNYLKAQGGSSPETVATYIAPLLNLCQPRDLRVLYSDLITIADEKALYSVYSKLKNQKIDLATALAEGAQTVSLIADLSTRLAKFLIHLKNLRLNQAASDILPIVKDLLPLTRKKAANDFLAYRYGISPLINDIQGAAEMLAEYVLSIPKTFVRSRATISSGVPTSTYNVNNWQYTEDVGVTVTVKYKVTFQWRPFDISVLEQLGFTNPANVIWELTPFSFVFDWFLPIGNFLSSVSASDHLTVVSVERLIHITENRNVFGFNSALPTGSPTFTANGSVGIGQREVWTIREILPLPSLPLPRFKNPISKGHVANALAIFSQLVK